MDRHEIFIVDVSLDKEVSSKFWKSSGANYSPRPSAFAYLIFMVFIVVSAELLYLAVLQERP